MAARILPVTVATYAGAAVLLLTGCRGGDDNPKNSDKIAGVQQADKEMVGPSPSSSDFIEFVPRPKVEVPDTKIEMKPSGNQIVNLPTWVWLDKAKLYPVTVKAEIPGAPQWAETTAKPISLHLDPGTTDAKTFPASGVCPINDDGSIGTPYTNGKEGQDPPCGVVYLHSTSHSGPYKLKATVTWRISWKDSGGIDDDEPGAPFGDSTDVNVQEMDINVREIQAINR